MRSATAVRAPVVDPVVRVMSEASAHPATAMLAIEIATPDAPVR